MRSPGIGIGRDQIAKVRLEKLDALRTWTVIAPVKIFIWDSSKKRWWLCEHDAFEAACRSKGEMDRFPDNDKPYWRLAASDIPGEPVKAEK